MKTRLYDSVCKSILEQQTVVYHKRAFGVIEKILSKSPKSDKIDSNAVISRTNFLMKTLNCLTVTTEIYF